MWKSTAIVAVVSIAWLGTGARADEPGAPAPAEPPQAETPAEPATQAPAEPAAEADPAADAQPAAEPAPAAEAAPADPAEPAPPAEPATEPAPAEQAAAAEATAAEAATAEAATAAPAQPVSFKNQIAPLLVAKCLGCHGDREAQSDYQLTNFAALGRPGASGEATITPGQPEASLLFTLVASTDAETRMPKEGEPLLGSDVELVRQWIAGGAPFDGPDPAAPLASYAARPPHPLPPEAYRAAMPVVAVAFRPDGSELAVGGYREVLIYGAADGGLRRRLPDVAERVYSLAWSGDGRALAVAAGVPGQLGEVCTLDGDSGARLADFGATSDVALAVAFSPDGSRLAAGSADRSIRISSVADPAQQVLIEDHADWVLGLAWSPDGTKLVSASRDKTAKVFDSQSGDAQTTYSGHGQAVFCAGFSPDGAQVLTGGADRKVQVWNPADGAKIAEIGGFGHDVYRLLVADGFIWTCSADKAVRQHRLENREAVRTYEGHADWVFALDYHAASHRLASGSYDGQVKIWNTDDGANLVSWMAAPGLPTESAAVEPSAAGASD